MSDQQTPNNSTAMVAQGSMRLVTLVFTGFMVYQTETANRKPGIWLPDDGKHLANAAKYFIEYLLQ